MQSDGKLVASVAYYTSGKENFFAVRSTADGALDTHFAAAGIYEADLAPDGPYSEIGTLLLQPDGNIVAGGRAQRTSASPLVDFAATRLLVTADVIFADGFD
jgi:hypothetical protein